MSNKVILAGGAFQDVEGNPLANGYLTMILSQDASANQNAQVSGGRKLHIKLDTAGNVVTAPAQSVWGNDVLSPAGTFYTVSAYTAEGQRAWGPNQVQVISGDEFDVGTWVPIRTNVIPSGTIVINEQQILLETNGTPNASQNTLNLVAGTNVILQTEPGSGVIINSTGGSETGLQPFEGVPSGSIPGNVFTILGITPQQTNVIVNGLTLIPGIGYSQSGATITLTTALETGDTIYCTGLY
jgi:hypothetical protein